MLRRSRGGNLSLIAQEYPVVAWRLGRDSCRRYLVERGELGVIFRRGAGTPVAAEILRVLMLTSLVDRTSSAG